MIADRRKTGGRGSALRECAVALLERLDQPVDSAAADFLLERGAVVGDEAHALDDDVVRLPLAGLLAEPIVDGDRLLALLPYHRPDDRVLLFRRAGFHVDAAAGRARLRD